MVEEDIDLGRIFELTTKNKIFVNRLSFHETEDEFLEVSTVDFESSVTMLFGEMEQKTNIKL